MKAELHQGLLWLNEKLTFSPVLVVFLVLVDDFCASLLIIGWEQHFIEPRISLLFIHELDELGH